MILIGVLRTETLRIVASVPRMELPILSGIAVRIRDSDCTLVDLGQGGVERGERRKCKGDNAASGSEVHGSSQTEICSLVAFGSLFFQGRTAAATRKYDLTLPMRQPSLYLYA